MLRYLLAVVALVAVPWTNSFADLVLNINLTTQQFDWVNGNTINRLPDMVDDNRFGNFATIDVSISSPLPLYSGSGTHTSVVFDLSDTGTALEGLSFSTSDPPGFPASFSGTPAPPTTGTFSVGDFSYFATLAPGSYNFAPMASNWDGVVTVNVISGSTTPVPTLSGWGLVILFGLLGMVAFPAIRRNRI